MIVTAVLFVLAVLLERLVLPDIWWAVLPVYLVPYAVIGWRVLWKAVRHVCRGQVFDENFLMALATVGALATGEYPEAVFVMLFYRVGELFEELAVGKSRASIAALMDIRPDTARVIRGGEAVTLSPEEVAVDEIMIIRPGERIPLDGEVLEGTSALDTVALTGESLPRNVAAGDTVISGCVNLSGLLRVRVTKAAHESTVTKILEMVENAGEKKSKSEHFISRFAKYYTPAVVMAAVLLGVTPPLVMGAGDVGLWKEWLLRAMSFLVISCPCALVISVPLSFFAGIGGASKQGVLVKGSNYLEALAACDTVVFDKTGTLTTGRFAVAEVCPAEGFVWDEVLVWAAMAEGHSTHPIARALVAACPQSIGAPTSVEEVAGQGVRAVCDGKNILVGNEKWMKEHTVDYVACERSGTVVHVAVEGVYAGCAVVADAVKADAIEAVAALRQCGVKHTVMLSGDREAVAREVATTLGLDDYRAELFPEDKVTEVEKMLNDPARKGKLAFVGDGINDAPVLARADIGIAMGGMGSDAAIEAADVVLMNDKPTDMAKAIRLSRRTLRIVRQNIVFALTVKGAVLGLSALGLSGLWMAVFADVGVAVLAILNAMRCQITR